MFQKRSRKPRARGHTNCPGGKATSRTYRMSLVSGLNASRARRGALWEASSEAASTNSEPHLLTIRACTVIMKPTNGTLTGSRKTLPPPIAGRRLRSTHGCTFHNSTIPHSGAPARVGSASRQWGDSPGPGMDQENCTLAPASAPDHARPSPPSRSGSRCAVAGAQSRGSRQIIAESGPCVAPGT